MQGSWGEKMPFGANLSRFRPFPRNRQIELSGYRKSERGGVIISASSRRAVTSAERKSPSPSKYSHRKSSISMRPFAFVSWVSVKILPLIRLFSTLLLLFECPHTECRTRRFSHSSLLLNSRFLPWIKAFGLCSYLKATKRARTICIAYIVPLVLVNQTIQIYAQIVHAFA